MNFNISEIQLYQLFYYLVLGAILIVSFYIINNYIIPLLKDKHPIVNKYWEKVQIILWLLFISVFYIALFRVNMLVTLTFTGIVIGLGWNFWRNVFSGIVIKFNKQFQVGETLSTDFVIGELKSINLFQSELINDVGELVIVPNYKLSNAVLKHFYKKSNVQTHTFSMIMIEGDVDAVRHVTLDCPYISANQKIDVEKVKENHFSIKASVIDADFLDEVNQYFLSQHKVTELNRS